MAMNFTPIPFDFLEEMEELSDAEYGRLVRWGQKYHLTGEMSKLCGNERFYAKRMQMQIDRYREHYNEIANAKAEAGRKGAEARWQKIAQDGKAINAMADDGENGYTKTNTNTKTNTQPSNDGMSNRRFRPPTREEVRAYCQERQNRVDADKWFDYYSSNGWRVGKNTMKDWKAAVRTWERNEFSKPQNAKNIQPSMNYGEADRGELENMRRILNKGVGA